MSDQAVYSHDPKEIAKREQWLAAQRTALKTAQDKCILPKPPSSAKMEEYGGFDDVIAELWLPSALGRSTRVCAMLDTMALLCGGRVHGYSDLKRAQLRDYIFINPAAEIKFRKLAEDLLGDYEGCRFG